LTGASRRRQVVVLGVAALSEKILPVILAGGQGTRLWPLSRADRPKQFLPWMGGKSLFQRTLLRVGNVGRYRAPIVVTHADYWSLVQDGAADIGQALRAVLLEPVARNTAAAIVAAAEYAVGQFGPDTVLHVLPSDQDVVEDQCYWRAIGAGLVAARRGGLVTFGIRPTAPETGYGYIKSLAKVGHGAAAIDRFVEKPTPEHASAMLAEGDYFWNSGMFIFRAGTFLAECDRLAPEVTKAVRSAMTNASTTRNGLKLHAKDFASAPSISVDYAVFEKTAKAVVVATDFAWADLGNWDSVWKTSAHDAGHNFIQGDVTLDEVTGSLVVTDHAHVAIHGLSDVAVVATKDAIVVTRRSMAQKVSAIVQRLRDNAHTRALTEQHHTAYRPWGNYASVAKGDRYQVKRLFVRPSQKLSLQKHHHRAEHWIVVKGTAEVTIDGKISILSENQSVFLPLGCVHRLANPGKIDLELIEVQTGAYLGEDDIVRIEDDYGRA
jgi:mannose-1-phosphate guanylyltransferase